MDIYNDHGHLHTGETLSSLQTINFSSYNIYSYSCKVPLLFLHYFELSTMIWVSLEAYYLHLLIYVTFVQLSKRIRIYMILGHVLPFVLICTWVSVYFEIYHASSMHCIRFKLIKKLLRSLNIPGLIDFARVCPYNSKMQYFQKPIFVSYKCKSNRALSQLQASNDETINTHLMTLIIFKLILLNLNLFEHFEPIKTYERYLRQF